MASPLTPRTGTSPDTPQDPRTSRTIRELIKDENRSLLGWAILIGAWLIGFLLSEGTEYHQLAVGILLSSTTLFALMALLEFLWRLFSRE
jgi:hypothetical protein